MARNSGPPVSDEGPRKLAAQGLVNRIVRGLLRTPLLCRIVGNRLISVYVVGRASGRQFAVPVAYTRHEGALLLGTSFSWGRNLRTGEPVNIRFKGTRRPAAVEVLVDEDDVVRHYAVMARDNRNFAKFNKIAIDATGDPSSADLHRAWEAGARGFRLTLH